MIYVEESYFTWNLVYVIYGLISANVLLFVLLFVAFSAIRKLKEDHEAQNATVKSILASQKKQKEINQSLSGKSQ